MMWRSGEQVLVQRGEVFVLLQPDGAVAGRFEPKTSSDEDDLWVTLHRVEGDRLIERTTIQHGGLEERVYEEKAMVTALRLVEDEATRRFVDDALGADATAQEAARREQDRVADSRLAAIDGSMNELGLGADASRAQRALGERVRRWNDTRAAALLRTLVALSRAAPGSAVTAAYSRGCLLACFVHELPAVQSGGGRSVNPALAAEIEAHARSLDDDADGQDQADAPRNASALRAAAEALRVAVGLLA